MLNIPRMELTVFTPESAKAFLKKYNLRNRVMRPSLVASYVQEMLAGRFTLTGDAISVVKSLFMISGQHRLQAVVEAGEHDPTIRVPMWVAYDLPDEAAYVVDRHRPHTAADNLRDEIPDAKRAISWLTKLDLGVYGKNAGAMVGRTRELYAQHEKAVNDLLPILPKTGGAYKGISTAPVAAAFIVAYYTNPTKIRQFAAQLTSGAGLGENDPLLKLRLKLVALGAGGSSSAIVLAFNVTLNMLYKKLHGETVKTVKHERNQEAFEFFMRSFPGEAE